MIRKVVSIVMISALVLTGFVSCSSAPEEKEEKRDGKHRYRHGRYSDAELG